MENYLGMMITKTIIMDDPQAKTFTLEQHNINDIISQYHVSDNVKTAKKNCVAIFKIKSK